MLERTFVFVKPGHVWASGRILSILDSCGKRTMQGEIDSVTKELIEEHYAEHKGKFYFPWMETYFVGRPAVAAVYSGDNVVKRVVEKIGATDPTLAQPGTIRRTFSSDSLELAIAEKRHVQNVIHRADSVASAEREIAIWLQYMKEIKN